MYMLFFLTFFSLCFSTPDLLILRNSDPLCTLSKHPRWLERHLPPSVPFSVIADTSSRFEGISNKIIFVSSLVYHFDIERIRQIPNSVVCVQSMFETDTIREDWVYKLNHYADLVVVPDSYLVDVYRNAGVNIPIFMLPIGCDLEKWLAMPPKNGAGSPFVFLASGSLHQQRKNHDILIESFIKAFKQREDVLLKIQVRKSNRKRAQELKSKYKLDTKKNIQFHFGSISDREYVDLMYSADCLVNISGGEGFSITPREALAIGMPAIVTNNTAQITICDSGFVRPVETPLLVPAYYDKVGVVGNYRNPTVGAVKEALLDVYRHYPHYAGLARKARPFVEQYTAKNLLPSWIALLHPKKVELGNTNVVTEEGIMTNSPQLYDKLSKIL